MFKQSLLLFTAATTFSLSCINTQEPARIATPRDTLVYVALRNAFIQTFGTPPQVFTRLSAQVAGGIAGAMLGAALAATIPNFILTHPELLLTEGTLRSEAMLAYCFLTLCETVGCIGGAVLGGKLEEFVRRFAAEFSSVKNAQTVAIVETKPKI
jgi:hypothetical protein